MFYSFLPVWYCTVIKEKKNTVELGFVWVINYNVQTNKTLSISWIHPFICANNRTKEKTTTTLDDINKSILHLWRHVHESGGVPIVVGLGREEDVAEVLQPGLENLDGDVAVVVVGRVDEVALGQVGPRLLVVGALQVEFVGAAVRTVEDKM